MADPTAAASGRFLRIHAQRYLQPAIEKHLQRFAGAFLLLAVLGFILPIGARAQVNAVSRFTLEKQKYLLGGPILCDFVIQNTGKKTFYFRYRSPDRALNAELENEPHFKVAGSDKSVLPDPAPRRCGGAKGSTVYGSVMLPPGQTHTERWLLNQWAIFRRPGRYSVRADRRIPLFMAEPGSPDSSSPAAFTTALDEIKFEVVPSSPARLRAEFEPYVKKLEAAAPADVAEPFVVVTTLPQPFFMDKLIMLAHAPPSEHRWDPTIALDGLARLGTPDAWQALVDMARRGKAGGKNQQGSASSPQENAVRAHAILLLAENGSTAFLPAIVEIMDSAPPDLRQDALRALGFFHSPRAADVLFKKLRSPNSEDRVNAILGVKNLGGANSIPALMEMLKDPDDEVRQVANFALEGLTGQRFSSSGSGNPESTSKKWHDWWVKNAATFTPPRPPACHDW